MHDQPDDAHQQHEDVINRLEQQNLENRGEDAAEEANEPDPGNNVEKSSFE